LLILCHKWLKNQIYFLKNFGFSKELTVFISLSHLVDYLKQGSDQVLIERIEAYRRQYGV
jgi:hypothetical protein